MSEQTITLPAFLQLEREIPVDRIRFNGMPVWIYLRTYLFYASVRGLSLERPKLSKRTLLGSLLIAPWKLLIPRRYWVFSNSSLRKEVRGEWMDPHDFSEDLKHNALFIELPGVSHPRRIASHHRVSKLWLYAFEWLLERLALQKIHIEGREEFELVIQRLGLNFRPERFARQYLAQYTVTRLMARWHRPHAVFLITYYTNIPRIAACKSLGIPVVEAQHGLISASHPGYMIGVNSIPPAANDLFPDWLLTYGEQEEQVLSESFYRRAVKIRPCGHFYLDYIRNHRAADALPVKGHDTRYRICFTAQDAVGAPFIAWLNALADILPEDELVLIPRQKPEAWYRENGLSARVTCFQGNTYRIIQSSDIHSTIYSTCALESLFLGTPNILMDIDGQATQHFGNMAHPATQTWITATPAEFALKVNQMKMEDVRSRVSADRYFTTDFESNITAVVKEIAT